MGDIGLLRAAVAGLMTSEARKAALMRHLWRPQRFKALLTRYSNPARDIPEMNGGQEIGLRDRAEVEARIARLREDSAVPPISGEEIALIDALLSVSGNALEALEKLRALQADLPSIADAVAALDARYTALAARDVDLARFAFETSYGRTTLEYYDGFVFGFTFPDRSDLPPIATGGRYDALTRAIGGGAGTPAVGGVIRPGLLLQLAEGAR
jgi:ATP phosphoribosyltransferase regulatory subunit